MEFIETVVSGLLRSIEISYIIILFDIRDGRFKILDFLDQKESMVQILYKMSEIRGFIAKGWLLSDVF